MEFLEHVFGSVPQTDPHFSVVLAREVAMNAKRQFGALLLVGLLTMVSSPVFSKSTKTAYINAKIYSGTEELREDAFLVKDGRFARVGSTEEIRRNSGGEIVDLKGARVLPGFIESHAHFLGVGQSKLILDLRDLQPHEIQSLVYLKAKKQARDSWIEGRGWDQNLWPNKRLPHKKLLSKIKSPVYLRRVDGHAALLNDRALRMAGIDRNTIAPEGGQIVKDESGEPSGVLIDNALSLITPFLTKPTTKELEHYLELASSEALSLGITSFHDAGTTREALDLFEKHARAGKLQVRLYAMLNGEDLGLVERFLKRGPINIDNFLTVRAIKYFADGALGSKGAQLLEDYDDQPGHRGLRLIEQPVLVERTKRAISRGFQVATHAIGDAANRMVLDAYREALLETKIKNHRLRIEHAQLIHPADRARFHEISVIASMQPIHCTSDMTWLSERLSETRAKERAFFLAVIIKKYYNRVWLRCPRRIHEPHFWNLCRGIKNGF